MNVQIWPFSISLRQLLILTAWSALALLIWQNLVKRGADKVVALIIISPIILLTIVIAFFSISELSLIPFIAKLLRTYFFDYPVKKYSTYKTQSYDPLYINIAKLKTEKEWTKIEEKNLDIHSEKEKLKKLDLF